MKQQEKIIKELDNYYEHLITRFKNGFKYVGENPGNEKAYEMYENIIKEVQIIETARMFYKELKKHEA